jgi:hypothetical protein
LLSGDRAARKRQFTRFRTAVCLRASQRELILPTTGRHLESSHFHRRRQIRAAVGPQPGEQGLQKSHTRQWSARKIVPVLVT